MFSDAEKYGNNLEVGECVCIPATRPADVLGYRHHGTYPQLSDEYT